MQEPSDLGRALGEAAAQYQAGHYGKAAALLADILRAAPDHPVALRLRGLALARSGTPAEGLPLLARAWALQPREPLAWMHYGVGLHAAGRYARAAAMFRRAAMMLPADPVPWINLSAALLALNLVKAARAAARRATGLAPGDGPAWYALGMAEQAAHDIRAARDAYRQAARLAPGFAEAWVNLGVVLYQLGEIGEANAVLRRALRVRPGFGLAEANLAALELLRGETETALDRLRRAIAADPACHAARINLANALLLERQPGEALALLEAEPPAGRDGAHWRAHRAMALLMLHRPEDARAELDAIPPPYGDAEILVVWRRLRLAMLDGDRPGVATLAARLDALAADETAALIEHRIVANLDLARYHNAGGRRARAFDYWIRGHSLLARSQPFSRGAYTAFEAATVECFSAERMREGQRASNRDAAPAFIVGMPRSGTTLLEQILAAHGAVHGAGERPAITQAISRLGYGIDSARSVRGLAALDEARLDGAAEGYLAELHALAPDARIITDKMPGNARHLGFIATLLPGARVIHCQRDPRDIGLSIFQLRFFGYHPYAHDLGDLGWYIGHHARLMAHWRAALPLPLLEVALEDWVHDFDGTLRRVLAFLELDYDPACERYYELDRRVRTASSDQVRQPINARGLGRWRAYEAELAPMIAELRAAGLVGTA